MLINLRNALMTGKRLPYDAELEYLESTGTQWIDTGIVHDQTFRWECDAEFTGIGSENRYIGQTYKTAAGGGAPRFAFGSVSTRKWYAGLGNLNQANSTTADTDRHIFVLDAPQKTFQVDANTYAVNWSSFSLPTYVGCGLGLFGRSYLDTDGEVHPYCLMRIYSSKHYQNGVLVRDFIPVRVGNVGYLYERVSGKLFGNAGTGDFVLGPDVVPVEYIESHGTEWIDTGLDYFADFEIGIKLRSSVSNKALGTSVTMCMDRHNAIQPYWRLNVNSSAYISAALIVDYHVMSWKGGVFAADGVTVYTVSNPFASGTMTLFGAGGQYFPNMIYACKLWDANGILVRSFRPVRVGTEGAMMDVLTRRIYRNAGTGAFSYGNDLKYPIPAA